MRRVLIAPLALATGCTLFTSLGGLSGGPEPDAGPTKTDASMPTDAPATVAETGADAGPRGCPSLGAHTVCDDFDDTNFAIENGWKVNSTGTVAADTSLFVSPSRSLVLGLPQGAPSCSYAELYRSVSGSFHHAKLSMSMRVGSADGNGKDPGGFLFGLGVGGKCKLFVAPQTASQSVYFQNSPSGDPGQNYKLTSGLATGVWTRITAQVDATSSPYLVVEIEGQTVLTVTTMPAACKLTGDVDVSLGQHCYMSSGAIETRMDDVTVDVE